MENNKKNIQKGFTLVEILTVMAIIGILAGIIFISLGKQRERARKASAMTTAKSIMPYAQECLFKGENLTTIPTTEEAIICNNSPTKWPKVNLAQCGYVNGTITTWKIKCTFDSGDVTIVCDAETGECI